MLQGIHHAAYRCRDAQETVAFYKQALDMDLLLAISEDRVPSTKERTPICTSSWTPAGAMCWPSSNCPTARPWGAMKPRRPGCNTLPSRWRTWTPWPAPSNDWRPWAWTWWGPPTTRSSSPIYFHDPSGHRIELAANTVQPGDLERLREVAPAMMEEWGATRRTVKQAAWLHEAEFTTRA